MYSYILGWYLIIIGFLAVVTGKPVGLFLIIFGAILAVDMKKLTAFTSFVSRIFKRKKSH